MKLKQLKESTNHDPSLTNLAINFEPEIIEQKSANTLDPQLEKVIQDLKNIDLSSTNPKEALDWLYAMQDSVKGE